MRNAILLLIVSFVVACAPVAPVKLEAQATQHQKLSFTFVDGRSPEQKRSLRAPERQGVMFWLGDDVISPPAPAMFTSTLEKHLGPELAKRNVTLRYLTVWVHDRGAKLDVTPIEIGTAAAGSPVAAPFVGTIATAISLGFSEKSVGVDIYGTVDDKPFQAQGYRTFRFGEAEAEIKATISEAVEIAARLIRGSL
jgi:hypothetical protein